MWAQISYDVSKIIEKYVNKDSIGIDIILGGIFVDNILIQIHFFFLGASLTLLFITMLLTKTFSLATLLS